MKKKPAVFLDRDGTLIDLVHHLVKPSEVKVDPKAGEAVRKLRERGYACVLVTNQSVIGRGMLTVEGLQEIHRELDRQLEAYGAKLDGLYYCPVAPKESEQTVIEHPDRKPGPGMLLRAASELDLDLERSWMVGDTLSDMLAGKNARCKGTILVKTGYGSKVAEGVEGVDHRVEDLWAAMELITELDAPKKTETKGEE
jgi:D,D-heptose 1,7-bisphosphate phosphatase